MASFQWAVISSGKIAQDFASAIRQLPGHEVSAVVSRSRRSAAEFAAQHCPGASLYTSIDEMTHDTSLQLDAAYVASPNDAHAPFSTKLLEAGKAVLCEKPLGTTIQEVEGLVAKAREKNTFLMEGMWTRCFPATVKARELLEKAVIGPVVAVQAEFGYEIANGCPASVRGNPEVGGMTSDIGIYLAEKALLAYPADNFDCTHSTAAAIYGVADGVDLTVAASLRFAAKDHSATADHEAKAGGVASLMWTGLADTPETAAFIGINGSIAFDHTAHTPSSFLLRERVSRTEYREQRFEFSPPPDDSAHAWNYPGSICLQYEALAVGEAVRAGLIEAPEWNFADCIAAHRILHKVKAYLKRQHTAH